MLGLELGLGLGFVDLRVRVRVRVRIKHIFSVSGWVRVIVHLGVGEELG